MTMPLPMAPTQILLHSDQHNGQFLFVSNDMEGPDKVVEAHPPAGEFRNRFEAQSDGNGGVRLYNPATGFYLFVSDDDAAGDKVVEGHPYRDEPRNSFIPLEPEPGSFMFLNPTYGRFLFLSNDQRAGDYVIEAHPNVELRNRFTAIPVA
ncbi:hypothetical protein [Streptomyces sp. 3213.3]|uniref:hypothetical protein n=1 Tax=Streptomyces sp. 3213.3 TaxID=1855348 RepID=UPI000B82A730|nr:hypothetical protein [Streptomyces sp. 3213.3]